MMLKENKVKRCIAFILCLATAIVLLNIPVTKSDAADTPVAAGVKSFQTYINNNLPLQYLGTPLAIDGNAGELTKRAASKLIQYRLNIDYNAGLAVDGHIGPASQAAFNLHIDTIKRYDGGFWVYILQGLLYCHNYNPDGFDGSYGRGGGTGCLNAVNQYKADNFIDEYPDTTVGAVGMETLASLCWKSYSPPPQTAIATGLQNGATYYLGNCFRGEYLTAQMTQPRTLTFLNSDEYLKFKVIYRTSTGYYSLYNEWSGKYLAHTPSHTLVYTTEHSGATNIYFKIERDNYIGDTTATYSIKGGDYFVTYPSSTNFSYVTLKSSDQGKICRWSFSRCNVYMPVARFYCFNRDGDNFTGPVSNFNNLCNTLYYNASIRINYSAQEAYLDLINNDRNPVAFWLFSGHGNSGYIDFYEDEIFATSFGGVKNLMALNTNRLASIQCMLFMGCYTGLDETGSGNLVIAALNRGAHFALGTTRDVGYTETDTFIKKFLERAAQQYTFEECIDYAILNSPYVYTDIYYLGDVYQILPEGE